MGRAINYLDYTWPQKDCDNLLRMATGTSICQKPPLVATPFLCTKINNLQILAKI